jgi:hypothetical protein
MRTLSHGVTWNRLLRVAFGLGAVHDLTEDQLVPEARAQDIVDCEGGSATRTISTAGSHPHGYMFVANNRTEPECLDRALFGLPASSLQHMQQHIEEGTICMLYNTDKKSVRGPFYATEAPEKDIEPKAWKKASGGRPFPAQVRVRYGATGCVKRQIAQANGGYLASNICCDLMQVLLSASCDMDDEEEEKEGPVKRKKRKQRKKRTDSSGSDMEAVTEEAQVDDEAHAPGYVFVCTKRSEPECLGLGVFGLPAHRFDHMTQHIAKDTVLFLYNRDTKTTTGPFTAEDPPAMGIVPAAFKEATGKTFPAQVRVKHGPLGKSKRRFAEINGNGGVVSSIVCKVPVLPLLFPRQVVCVFSLCLCSAGAPAGLDQAPGKHGLRGEEF